MVAKYTIGSAVWIGPSEYIVAAYRKVNGNWMLALDPRSGSGQISIPLHMVEVYA